MEEGVCAKSMSIGEQRVQAMVDKAVKEAIRKLKECGTLNLTTGERALLALGASCGINALVEEVYREGLQQPQATDHFAE